MKISIITTCFNSARTLPDTIASVLSQRGADVEYIVVDGGSSDGTVELLRSFEARFSEKGLAFMWKSAPDKGMYDALNKGIAMAAGDVVGILNADDVLSDDETLAKIASAFSDDVDAVYADIRFVRGCSGLSEMRNAPTVRYCSAALWRPWMFRFGAMVPHPSFYVRRGFFSEFGGYSLKYRICADFELELRFLGIARLRTAYLRECVVTMRMGGASTAGWRSNVEINREDLRALRAHGVWSCLPLIYSKCLFKIWGFLKRGKSASPAGGGIARAIACIVAATSLLCSSSTSAQECDDGSCPIPSDVEPQISVFAPVPQSSVESIPPAPRLDSLDGKTVAIVGGSFMANVTHPEIKRLLLAEHPTAKILLLDEIGSAGPYPRPGVVRRAKDEFQRKLESMKVDAVISGNGGCGLCTPKETGSCIAAEAIGIPSVMIAAPGFVRQAKSTARAAGLGDLRVAEYPGAFASHTREELIENTRKSLWPQIRAALVAGWNSDASAKACPSSGASDVSSDNVLISGTVAEIRQIFLDSGWTDGLPVIPPTEETVAGFLRFTDLRADHSLGIIPPAQRAVTVRDVAVNGAMAGCPPEFMPVLIAFVEGMKDGDFRRTLSSTHAWTPYCWINGPVASQLGFDCGQGEISEPANAVFGRFVNLAMLNLGGYKVKENRMGTFGYLMPWTLAEDEAAAARVGWKPHHVEKGFAAGDSTLTLASSINWGNNLVPATPDPVRIKDMMAWDAVEKSQMALASGTPCTWRVFFVTEGVARDLAKKFPSKKSLIDALEKSARIPLGQRAFANYWGNPGSAFDPLKYPLPRHERRIAEKEGSSMEPVPPWLAWTGLDEIESVPAMSRGKTAVVVTGDPSRNKVLCVPGGGFKTVKIRLPANWDSLIGN